MSGRASSGADQPGRRRILFTGHAPVHFLCFRPLFERLRGLPGAEVYVSGGYRQETGSGFSYDPHGLYGGFGVPQEHILTVPEILEQDFDLLFSANTKALRPRRHSMLVQIFHGISFRNRAIRSANMTADRYFMVGPYMKRKFVESGLMEADDPRALDMGFMKTDALLDGSLDRRRILERSGLDGGRPVIAFCPTGQSGHALEVYGLGLLERLAATNHYDVLIKLHDHPHDSVDWSAAIRGIESPHLRLVADLDVIPILFAADLLITDASSVSNEYALLDRPMIFMDTPDLIAKAQGRTGSMTDTGTWGRSLGEVVSNLEDLVPAVERALERPEQRSELRRRAARDLFFNPGAATGAALTWFLGLGSEDLGSHPHPLSSHAPS